MNSARYIELKNAVNRMDALIEEFTMDERVLKRDIRSTLTKHQDILVAVNELRVLQGNMITLMNLRRETVTLRDFEYNRGLMI